MGELRRLRWCDLDLVGPQPQLTIWGKSQKFQTIPIRSDLAADLLAWRDAMQPHAVTDLVFRVPDQLSKLLSKDLVAAGISKADSETD